MLSREKILQRGIIILREDEGKERIILRIKSFNRSYFLVRSILWIDYVINEIFLTYLRTYIMNDVNDHVRIMIFSFFFFFFFLAANLPEAVITKCKKCTDKQKENFEYLAVWYNDNRPDEWNALIKKFMEDAKKMNVDTAK